MSKAGEAQSSEEIFKLANDLEAYGVGHEVIHAVDREENVVPSVARELVTDEFGTVVNLNYRQELDDLAEFEMECADRAAAYRRG